MPYTLECADNACQTQYQPCENLTREVANTRQSGCCAPPQRYIDGRDTNCNVTICDANGNIIAGRPDQIGRDYYQWDGGGSWSRDAYSNGGNRIILPGAMNSYAPDYYPGRNPAYTDQWRQNDRLMQFVLPIVLSAINSAMYNNNWNNNWNNHYQPYMPYPGQSLYYPGRQNYFVPQQQFYSPGCNSPSMYNYPNYNHHYRPYNQFYSPQCSPGAQVMMQLPRIINSHSHHRRCH